MFTNKKIRMRAANTVYVIKRDYFYEPDVDSEHRMCFLRGQNRYWRQISSATKLERTGLKAFGTFVAKACKDPGNIFEYARKVAENDDLAYAELLGYLDGMLTDVA